MASNIEFALLTRAIADNDFHSVEKARIDDSYFTNDVCKQVYQFLKMTYHHPQTVGHVPSFEMVQHRFPAFFPAHAPDTVPILCAEIRRQRIRGELLLLAQDIQLKTEIDPMAAMADLRARSAMLASMSDVGEDLSMSSAFNFLLEQYNMVQTSGGMLGIPFPWAALNEETQGMQDGQFIVIYGRPKSMKTWVAVYIAVCAYLYARKRILFYTREMSPRLVAVRIAAALAGVDYKAFKNGTLQPALKAKVFTILQELMDDEISAGAHGNHQPYFIITSDRAAASAGSSGGVSWLQAKIRELQPDLVIVDGMYLMKDDRTSQRSTDWKQIAHISQDLKLTAQEFEVPLIGVTQANRAAQHKKGEDLTELAFSDSIGQDADAVLRVSKKERIDEATKIKRTELILTAPGLREGKFEGIVIHGEPATNFSYIRTIVESDFDEEEEYADKKGGGGGQAQHGGGGGPKSSFKRPTFMTPQVPMKGA